MFKKMQMPCKLWKSVNIDIYWEFHYSDFWNDWAVAYHSTWKVWAYRDLQIFDTKAIHIYVFLKKQLERVEYYKISEVDQQIELVLKNLIQELFAITDRRGYNNVQKVKETVIASLDSLRVEIENCKEICNLGYLIQNKKTMEFKKTLEIPLNEIVNNFILKNVDDVNDKEYFRRYLKYKQIQKRDLNFLDDKIILNANRDILKSLQDKDRTIEELKIQAQMDLQKVTEEKEKFYLDKYKNDMSKVVSDAKCKVENVQKELEFTHSYNAKEKQEMRKEIQDLTFKLDDTLAQNKRLNQQIMDYRGKDNKIEMISNKQNSNLIENNSIIFDWSDLNSIIKVWKTEDLKFSIFTIINLQSIDSEILGYLYSFISTKMMGELNTLKVEADGENKLELSKFLEIFQYLLVKVSTCIYFQGFNIDLSSLVQVFELSEKSKKLSFKNWIIEVGSDFKINENIEFQISELEFIGINPKVEKDWKNTANNLIIGLSKCNISKSLKKVTLSQSNSFGSALWEAISNEFKDKVETAITKDPWLFNDIL